MQSKGKQIFEPVDLRPVSFRLAEAVGSIDEGDTGFHRGGVVPLGVSHVDTAADVVFADQGLNGQALPGAGLLKAQMAFDIGGQAELLDAHIRITQLAVADDEKPVLFVCLQGSNPVIGETKKLTARVSSFVWRPRRDSNPRPFA